jgi:hypothetical protein
MTDEEIHNIYLHMSGKAEGLVEATGKADFPVLFARAILEYSKNSKKQWVWLTNKEVDECLRGLPTQTIDVYARRIETKIKDKNNG